MRKLFLILILLSVCQLIFAQTRTVTGTVKDDKGNVVPFASVTESNTNNATQADANGNFSIRIPQNSRLTVSAVGYLPQTSSISGTSSNFILERGSEELQEVVLTALGVSTRKDRLAVSQSTVKGNDLVTSGETSVLNGMASKASGVQIVRSGGDPGAGSYIQIRGQSTITGNLQPLFIIDGIPASNATSGQGIDGVVQQSRLNDLNPEDVESMEILKGASAAALYGTQAANGVVLITTKKGRASRKLNISLTSTYSIDELNRSVPLQTSYGQGTLGQFRYGPSSANRAWGDKIADRTGGDDVLLSSGAYVLLPDGSKRYLIPQGTAADPHGGKRSKQVYDHSTDLFENGAFWDNTIALSGGDEKGVFYTSFSVLNQNGILKAGSDYDRKTFRLNADRKFGMVKLAGTFNYINSNSDRAQQGSNISGIFLGGLRTAPDYDNTFFEGTYIDATGLQFPNRQISYRNPIGARTNSGYDNPNWILRRILNRSIVNRANGSFEATFTPLSWLTIVERAGLDNYTDRRLENFPTISASFPGGNLTMQNITETRLNNDLFARGNFDINKNITLSALLGWNFNHRRFENLGSSVRNFINEDILNPIFDLGNSPIDARFPFNGESQVRTTAGYGQLSFGLFDQLFLDLTGRSEAASTFNNTFFYPSASLAWQFSKLPFLNASKFLSFGKLRASYGEVGVQPGPYLLSTYYNPLVIGESYGPALDASSSTYGNGGFSRSSIKGNPDIEPERKKEFELGADLRFANNRVSLSGTYYKNKTEGAIFSVQVPATTGFTNINDNAAEIENKGYELDLGINWLKSKDFSVTTNLVASTNKNKVVSLKGVESYFLAGFTGSSSRAVEGQPLGVLWGVDFLRADNGKGALVLNADGFPQNAPAESVIGDPNPDWLAGLKNTIRWKNINLSFLIDHVQGGDVWNGTKGALYTFGTHAETGYEVTAPSNLTTYDGKTIAAGTKFRGAVKDFGAGPVALTQAWYTDLGGGFGPVGSQFIEEGTRTRLREIVLGYTVNGEGFRKKTRLQSIDFSVTGRNLFLWTDYSGIDPETNLTGPSNGRGLDYFNNPSTRSYLFTMRINY